ncbi:MAG: hypothetical protein JSV89_17825 [Spirochaetaceae bacterium]|nr:MAG: hypothetical protein JSV89_17825 [Spirochaetaceae bacterium]
MAKPTYQDATLLLQMAQWSASSGLDEVRNWLWSDEFVPNYSEFRKKYPQGSEGNGKAHKICGWMETLGTLYKHKLINEELLFDWMAVDLVWERLKDFVLGVRNEVGDERMLENFEAMAKAQKGKC